MRDIPHSWYFVTAGLRIVPPRVAPSHYEMRYEPIVDILSELAAIIGDAFGNMREALDYIGNGMAPSPGRGERVYVPLCRTRDGLASHGGYRAMIAAFPACERVFLDRLGPADDPKNEVWRALAEMSVENKHICLIPTVAIAGITGVGAVTGGVQIRNFTIGNDAAKPFVMVHCHWPITPIGSPSISIDAKFGDDPYTGPRVLDVLSDILAVVQHTIRSFEAILPR